jgi:hypothetical protein
MRRALPCFLAVALATPSGCNWLTGGKAKDGVVADPPRERPQDRPAADYVAYLNRQAGYLKTVRYNDLNLNVSIPGQLIPGLNNGMVVCGQANNFRMNAKLAVGGTQLDVGSNAQEMWMYVKHSDPQYLYCSHAEFPQVQQRLPVKFEPNWVLQALGMATYDPNRDYTIEPSPRRGAYYLRYTDTTATGEKVLKVTEFAAGTMTGANPQVRGHYVMTADERRVMIAAARILKVSEHTVGTDPVSGGPAVVQLPTEVSLEWPQEKVKMDLQLSQIKVNERMTQQDFDDLFRRPRTIGAAQPVNLAEYLSATRSGGGVARAVRPDDALPRR